jgi:predicted Zn-dependent protease
LQWQQAYLQSLLYVEYLTKTHGEETVAKVLAEYAKGASDSEAIPQACQVTKADFEKGYTAFLRDRVKNIKFKPAPKQMTERQLRAALEKMPNDVDLKAQLAETLAKVGKKKDAKRLAEEVLDKQREHPTALYVRALIAIADGEQQVALGLLESVNTDDKADAKILNLLADIQMKAKQLRPAANTLERCRKVDPDDVRTLTKLVTIYTELKDKEKILDVLQLLVAADYDELPARRLLARHYLDKGDANNAERMAREAMEIDVLDRESQDVLLEALSKQGKDDHEARIRKLLKR